MTIHIATDGKNTTARSPYHPDLPARAKALGGKWDGDAWTFDARDEARVQAMYREIYGTDGTDGDLVTIRCSFRLDYEADKNAIFIGGREVARARGRDSGATIGDGVVFVAGSATSGGSAKNWKTIIREGSVVEIRDMPRTMAERVVAEHDDRYHPEIMEETKTVDVDALKAERDRLMARLAQIDAMLDE
jgi:hypothetical protein